MKIVQLTTSDMGGAGIAAKQLHLALLNNSTNSVFLSKVKLGQDFAAHQIVKTNSAFADLSGFYRKNQKPEFEYFSFPFSETDLTKVEAVGDSDIIHLHWISDGFIDYKNVFNLNKKFVWTLHDMNPFTGGCHHSDGCNKFEKNCNYCFQLEGTVDEYVSGKILNYKREALSNVKDDQLVIVTPSQWLSDLSKKSSVLKRFEHVVIPNIVQMPDLSMTSEIARQNLGVSKDEFVFLIVAHSVNNLRKGIRVLMEAINQLSGKKNITLLLVGEKSGMKFQGIKTIELGFVTDKNKLSEVYNAADVFLLPSLAENFPNTIVEALSCGTPVLASGVGGISEQVNSKNGVLVGANNVSAWTKALTDMISTIGKYDRKTISQEARQRYNQEDILKQYLQIYQRLLK